MIAIIGLLTTVSVIAFTSVRAQARDAQRVSDAATIRRALEMYLAEGVGYPVSSSTSGECLKGTVGIGLTLINNNSIKVIPFDPLWGNSTPPGTITDGYASGASSNFCYWYSGTVTDYNLSYYLEEGNSNSGAKGIHVINSGGEK